MRTQYLLSTRVAVVMSLFFISFGVYVANASDNPDSVGNVAGISPKVSKGNTQTVGLVLSGGGAKGIAHVGVIKALEENGIPIDYVTGTSMGAIVGSLYSCGWSPEKMIEFFTSEDFKYWSSGTINKNRTYYLDAPSPIPQWLTLNLNFKDSTNLINQVVPSHLISPLPMNIEFMELYAPYTRQCDENFNNLFVPFRCVTSDVYHKHKVVMKSGSLGDAVRASMSFPLVFKPIKIDGLLMYDGGIYDNFPVDVMHKDFDPDFIIGVSVSAPDGPPQEGDVYSQLQDMIIQNNNYSLPADEGIKIQVPVLDFGVLDFAKGREIYDIGYRTGLNMVDSIKSRVSSRRSLEEVTARREQFASRTPVIMFDSVSVGGCTPRQADYLKYLFDHGSHKPFGMAQAQDAYYTAVTGGKLANLLPQAIMEKDDKTLLQLDASVKNPWNVGIGGWITTSTNSMMFVNFGYNTLDFNSLDANVSGWIGQAYYAGMIDGKFTLRTRQPSYMKLEAVISRQKYYDSEILFFQNGTPSFVVDFETFVRMNYSWAMGRKAIGIVDLGYGYSTESYYTKAEGETDRERSQYKTAVVRLGFEKNTLDNIMYPSAGMELKGVVAGIYERNRFMPSGFTGEKPDYKGEFRADMELTWRDYFGLHSNWRLGVMTNLRVTAEKLNQVYTAYMVHCNSFAPTPSTKNYFNEAFRSNNYVAAGLIPIWSPVSRMQLRGEFYVFSPIRNVSRNEAGMAYYNGWMRRAEFIGEIAAVYNFPFASLSAYVNYLSYPARNWNFGINFGLLLLAPKLHH